MEIIFLEPPENLSPYCWLIGMGPRRLGVHKRDGWCMQLDERLVFFDSEDSCVPLVPIIEIEVVKFLNFLKVVEISNPDYSESIRKFPKKLLLKHIFHSSFSGYWPDKALEWLIADQSLQPFFKEELKKFITNKVMPQKSRQKAKIIFDRLSTQRRGHK